MSTSTLESPASRAAQARVWSYTDEVNAAEQVLASEFRAAARTGDVSAIAAFAPQVTDWNAPANPASSGAAYGVRPKRAQTVGEVLFGTLGDGGNAMGMEAMQLLCRAANGEDVQAACITLLVRMGDDFARANAGL